MNISRSKDSTINEAKAVLKAARLLRLQSISPSSSYDSYSLLCSTRKNKQQNEEEECRSFRSSNSALYHRSSSISDKNVDSLPSSSFARIHDKNCVSTNDDIHDVLQELKQIKQIIAKEIHVTKDIDNNLRTRIYSFMEACNLVLKEFDRRPEHESDTSCYSYEQNQQQNLDGKKKTSMLRRKSSLRNKFARQRSLSTTSCGSSSTVRFDLSQNEFFD